MDKDLVAIPCYNESLNLEKFLPKLEKARGPFDVIFVNDGSTDATKEILEKHRYAVISHEKNRGYSSAIRTGLSHALSKNYEYVCFIDSDGQHDPQYAAPAFRRVREENADLLIGSRFVENTHYRGAASRRLGMIFFRFLVKAFTGKDIHDTTSGFKVFNPKAMRLALAEPRLKDFHAEFLVYLLREGCRVVEMPVTVHSREHGRSMYTWKDCVVYPFKTFWAVLGILYIIKKGRGVS